MYTKFSIAMIKEIIEKLKAASLGRSQEKSRVQQHVDSNSNRTDESAIGTRSQLASLTFF